MQDHPLVALADAERLGDLGAVEAGDVAQQDHRALLLGQRVDDLGEAAAQLLREQLRLRLDVELGRRRRPAAVGVERGRVHGRALLVLDVASDENGTWRASRTARVRARLTRMRKIHVFKDERSSKRSSPLSTASHVSWTTSSASASVRTNVRASRRSWRS